MEYDDAVDVTKTYLGHESIKITDTFRPEQAFPIYSNFHTWGKFIGGSMFDILLDTGASKSYMSKGFYMKHPHIHMYPKFNSMVRNLQVGNGELVELIGIVDLRSLGYYNIKPQVIHFNLTGVHNLFSKWNLDLRFEEHFAKISTQNMHYKKREVVRKPPDPYPWLGEDDPQRNMTNEEILYKYIDLSKYHLTSTEKEEVMDLIVT